MPKTAKCLKTVVCLLVTLSVTAAAGYFAWRRSEDLAAIYPPPPVARLPAEHVRILAINENRDKEDAKACREFFEALESRIPEGDERGCYNSFRSAKYVRARDLAEKTLRVKPDSILATYVLGTTLHRAEGNSPQALYQLRKARQLAEDSARRGTSTDDDRVWYVMILNEEVTVLCYLERWPELLKALDCLEAVYQSMPWRRAFPLLKQGKIAESRQALAAAEATGGWTGYCATLRTNQASFDGDRQTNYEIAKKTTDEDKGPCSWSNSGIGCLGVFRHAEAEQAYEKALTVGPIDYNGTPYLALSMMRLEAASMPAAWESLRKAQKHRLEREPYTLASDQARTESAAALLLLAIGQAADALPIIERVRARPDRTSSTTGNAEVHRLGDLLMHYAALQAIDQEQRETGDANVADQVVRQSARWLLRRQILNLMRREEYLAGCFCPNSPQPTGQGAPWLLNGALADLPAGLAEHGLQLARKQDPFPAAAAYYDAAAAELALRRGKSELALGLAQAALKSLDAKYERLLRARVAAVASEAARCLGRQDEQLSYLNQVLRDFPVALRLVDVALPIRLETDDSPAAVEFCKELWTSPRFTPAKQGFRLRVALENHLLTCELSRLDGQLHATVQCDPQAGGKAALGELTRKLMSPTLSLSRVEICSLQGLAGASQSRSEINKTLEQLKPKAAQAAARHGYFGRPGAAE